MSFYSKLYVVCDRCGEETLVSHTNLDEDNSETECFAPEELGYNRQIEFEEETYNHACYSCMRYINYRKDHQ